MGERPTIVVPLARKRPETPEQRFKRAIGYLWAHGVYPSPTALNQRVHGRRGRDMNGRECVWRRAEMTKRGIPLQRPQRHAHLDAFDPRTV